MAFDRKMTGFVSDEARPPRPRVAHVLARPHRAGRLRASRRPFPGSFPPAKGPASRAASCRRRSTASASPGASHATLAGDCRSRPREVDDVHGPGVLTVHRDPRRHRRAHRPRQERARQGADGNGPRPPAGGEGAGDHDRPRLRPRRLGRHRSFSFVDVPGHEKFVRTMVAGAQGVDLVLLAVASDDSVMPQTREHLDILKLLGVPLRRPRPDEERPRRRRRPARSSTRRSASLVEGSFLEDAPLVAVSAVTGAGIPDAQARPRGRGGAARPRGHATDGSPRLFLDRAFTMKGFGPVVTGTLDGGTIAVEDRLTLFPEGLEVRVRRLEVHGEERKRRRRRASGRA